MVSIKILLFTILFFLFSSLIIGGGNVALDATNSIKFCTSCHSMQINYEEYKDSIHYRNRSGVRTTCADCHVPKELGPKLWAKIVAAKDIYHEWIGTIDSKEKFEARRWELANRVWDKMKATNSRECRHCHRFEAMDMSEQDRIARKKHEDAEEKGKTCIDCHQGIAHEIPDEPEVDDILLDGT